METPEPENVSESWASIIIQAFFICFFICCFCGCCCGGISSSDSHGRSHSDRARPQGQNYSQPAPSSQQPRGTTSQPIQEQPIHIQTPSRQQTNASARPASEINLRTACRIELRSFELRGALGEEACPVCLEQLNKQRVSVGPCSHYVHAECLKQWLRRSSSSCPVCRTNFNT